MVVVRDQVRDLFASHHEGPQDEDVAEQKEL